MAALAQQLMPHLQQVHPQQHLDHMRASNGSSPRDQHIDPAIAGPGMMRTSPGESGGDDNGAGSDGRKTGKRELSTSKRAAQNISTLFRKALMLHKVDNVHFEAMKR